MISPNKQQGASILEFIIVLPILLVFIVLVSEVGILFYTINALNKSTQDAARYLSQDSTTYNNRLATAENLLRYGSPNGAGLPLLPGGNNASKLVFTPSTAANHVTISVNYQHDLILGTALGLLTGISTGGNVGFSNTFQLNASSVLRFTQ